MTLKETILGILHNHFLFATNKAADEITIHIIEFTEWAIEWIYFEETNYFLIVCKSEYDLCLGTLEEAYKYWLEEVKVKGIIIDVDLKQIDQAKDDYYNRDKLFERKK